LLLAPQGFLRADTTLNADERPSGLGYVKFDSADAALAALQVMLVAPPFLAHQ
jgi:hypothetical protein